MKFKKALKALIEGKAISREAWRNDSVNPAFYVRVVEYEDIGGTAICEDQLLKHYQPLDEWMPTTIDGIPFEYMIQDDWYIVE